ncbi:hypothetical protein OPV22_003227 [Ensete ventricosum]|uniref:Uncharacterized protein n=1 Tax=Ensete ventricosum TaxID=4639 RepID=A0AAV8RZZ1_ENSVE|nr:hypothetical protein OPV22_003227 [Ensete ventricosum]
MVRHYGNFFRPHLLGNRGARLRRSWILTAIGCFAHNFFARANFNNQVLKESISRHFFSRKKRLFGCFFSNLEAVDAALGTTFSQLLAKVTKRRNFFSLPSESSQKEDERSHGGYIIQLAEERKKKTPLLPLLYHLIHLEGTARDQRGHRSSHRDSKGSRDLTRGRSTACPSSPTKRQSTGSSSPIVSSDKGVVVEME